MIANKFLKKWNEASESEQHFVALCVFTQFSARGVLQMADLIFEKTVGDVGKRVGHKHFRGIESKLETVAVNLPENAGRVFMRINPGIDKQPSAAPMQQLNSQKLY